MPSYRSVSVKLSLLIGVPPLNSLVWGEPLTYEL